MSTKRIEELSYEAGWLRGVIQHAEQKLARVRDTDLSPVVLQSVLQDVIDDLKAGRERASEAAKAHIAET